MSTLFNTNQHAAINDVSVTSGNADGWVVVPLDLRAPMKESEKKQTKRGPKKE